MSVPATYRSGTPRDQHPAVTRWHGRLRGLATAIHETSGLGILPVFQNSNLKHIQCHLGSRKFNEYCVQPVSIRKPAFSDVILRSPAGATKNLEILRPAQSGTQDDNSSLRGFCPERHDLSLSTSLVDRSCRRAQNARWIFRMDTSYRTEKDEAEKEGLVN